MLVKYPIHDSNKSTTYISPISKPFIKWNKSSVSSLDPDSRIDNMTRRKNHEEYNLVFVIVEIVSFRTFLNTRLTLWRINFINTSFSHTVEIKLSWYPLVSKILVFYSDQMCLLSLEDESMEFNEV